MTGVLIIYTGRFNIHLRLLVNHPKQSRSFQFHYSLEASPHFFNKFYFWLEVKVLIAFLHLFLLTTLQNVCPGCQGSPCSTSVQLLAMDSQLPTQLARELASQSQPQDQGSWHKFKYEREKQFFKVHCIRLVSIDVKQIYWSERSACASGQHLGGHYFGPSVVRAPAASI